MTASAWTKRKRRPNRSIVITNVPFAVWVIDKLLVKFKDHSDYHNKLLYWRDTPQRLTHDELDELEDRYDSRLRNRFNLSMNSPDPSQVGNG